jgi:hypothetical protein
MAGETTTATFTFSEAVSGFSNADIAVSNGTLGAVDSLDGGTTWTATFTPNTTIEDATNVIGVDNTGYLDASGNAGTGTTETINFTIDTLRPTATIVVADTALDAGETSIVTITFTEPVTGLTNADLTIANGTLSAVSSSDGDITWTATLTPTAAITDTTNLVTLANTGVQDASGNTGIGSTDSNNYAIDTSIPAVTSVSVPASGTYVAGQNLDFTVTLSEAVIVDSTGGVPRIAVTLDTGGPVYAIYLSGSGSNILLFRLTVADGQLDANGVSLGGTIDTNGASVRNAQGEDASVQLNNVGSTTSVLVDTSAPTPLSVVSPSILVARLDNWPLAPPPFSSVITAPLSTSLPSIFDLQTDFALGYSSSNLAAPSIFNVDVGPSRRLDISLPWRAEKFDRWTVVELRSSTGTEVPAWLHYDFTTGTLQGTPPVGFHGTLQIDLVETDSHGQRVIGTMRLHFDDTAQRSDTDNSVKPPAQRAATKAGLDAQFVSHARSTPLDVDAASLLRQLYLRTLDRPPTQNHTHY